MSDRHEGFPFARAIAGAGYNAFVLKYRVGEGWFVATEDLAAAVTYVVRNAERLRVANGNYALWGSSAGARMAASIGSHGLARFGGDDVPKPAAVVLAYTGHADYSSDEPATFAVVGEQDRILGERYAIMGANFKLINAGYPIHSPVEAALTLLEKHHIRVDTIESIYVGMPTNTMKVVDGRDMHNICLQDVLSAALVQGGLKLRESPFPDILRDPAFSRLRARISLRGDADLDRDQPDGRGAVVAITTADGATVSTRIDHPRGHSRRGGLTWEELAGKWREGLPECDVAKMLALAQRLDEVEDVTEFLDAFRAKG